jgi:hypothetical protein
LYNFEAPPLSLSKAAVFSIVGLSSQRPLSFSFQLAALGGAAAFALAAVLALAALIARLAATLPFTGVLALAGVRARFPHRLKGNPCGSWFAGCEGPQGEELKSKNQSQSSLP